MLRLFAGRRSDAFRRLSNGILSDGSTERTSEDNHLPRRNSPPVAPRASRSRANHGIHRRYQRGPNILAVDQPFRTKLFPTYPGCVNAKAGSEKADTSLERRSPSVPNLKFATLRKAHLNQSFLVQLMISKFAESPTTGLHQYVANFEIATLEPRVVARCGEPRRAKRPFRLHG